MHNAINLINSASKAAIKLCNKSAPAAAIAIVVNKRDETSYLAKDAHLRHMVTDGDHFYRIQPTAEGFKFYSEFTGIIFLVH